MNIYRNMNRNQIQFDFLCREYRKDSYQDEIKELGGNIYYINTKPFRFAYNRKKYLEFFSGHRDVQIVHLHVSSLFDIEVLKAAYKCKLPIRAVHAHSCRQTGPKVLNILHFYNQLHITKYATDLLACSDLAGDYMYSNFFLLNRHYTIVNNVIDTEKFRYNDSARQRIRKELVLQNMFVIGNVARLAPYKNHMFLLDIFHEIQGKIPNAVLLIVGEGNLKQALEEKIHQLGLDEKVLLVGRREDVNLLYSVMDIFVFPSLFEGLGIALLEAQCSGLPCVVSKDAIPCSVKISDALQFVSLDDSISVWVDKIIQLSERYDRVERIAELKEQKYDIESGVRQLETFYLEAVEK